MPSGEWTDGAFPIRRARIVRLDTYRPSSPTASAWLRASETRSPPTWCAALRSARAITCSIHSLIFLMAAMLTKDEPSHHSGMRRGISRSPRGLPERLRQPRDFDGDPSRLVLCQHLRPPRFGFAPSGVVMAAGLLTGLTTPTGSRSHTSTPEGAKLRRPEPMRLWATMACRYQAGPRLSSRAGWGKRRPSIRRRAWRNDLSTTRG
jgi:hypothetical protein